MTPEQMTELTNAILLHGVVLALMGFLIGLAILLRK